MKRWHVVVFWQGVVLFVALFWGLLAGTVTQLLWGHWGGWLLGGGVILVEVGFFR